MITLDSRARKWVYGTCAFIANALFVLLLIWAESFDPNWKPLLWGMIALGGLVGFFVAASRTGAVGNVLPGVVTLAAGLLAAGSLLSIGAPEGKTLSAENAPFVGYVLLYLSVGALAGALLGIFFRNIITPATAAQREAIQLRQRLALERARSELALAEDLSALRRAEVEVARRFPTLRRKLLDLAKRIVDLNRSRVTQINDRNPPVAEFEYERYAAARKIVAWLGNVPSDQWNEVHSKTLATLMAFQAEPPVMDMPAFTDQPSIAPAGQAAAGEEAGADLAFDPETLLLAEEQECDVGA